MGLCKCPKKKVTNLFCFEHRVNVCEHCLVSNHTKCVVQSYLQWLQDSDYDPSCRLCGKPLSDENVGDCVRLVCYDVFHWSCLDHYARQLPPNTAPAGYTCPICKTGAFPAHNVASPVAEALREVLQKVNWARVGLGLPLIDEATQPATATSNWTLGGGQEIQPKTGDIPLTHTHSNSSTSLANIAPTSNHAGHSQSMTGQMSAYSAAKAAFPDSVVTMDSMAAYTRSPDFLSGHPADPRKLFDSTKGPGGDYMNISQDHDEDKYKRRPALQWFARWFRSRSPSHGNRRDPNATCKKFAIIIVLGLLGLITVIIIFSKLGRASADSDPFLDPMANPHIQVKDD